MKRLLVVVFIITISIVYIYSDPVIFNYNGLHIVNKTYNGHEGEGKFDFDIYATGKFYHTVLGKTHTFYKQSNESVALRIRLSDKHETEPYYKIDGHKYDETHTFSYPNPTSFNVKVRENDVWNDDKYHTFTVIIINWDTNPEADFVFSANSDFSNSLAEGLYEKAGETGTFFYRPDLVTTFYFKYYQFGGSYPFHVHYYTYEILDKNSQFVHHDWTGVNRYYSCSSSPDSFSQYKLDVTDVLGNTNVDFVYSFIPDSTDPVRVGDISFTHEINVDNSDKYDQEFRLTFKDPSNDPLHDGVGIEKVLLSVSGTNSGTGDFVTEDIIASESETEGVYKAVLSLERGVTFDTVELIAYDYLKNTFSEDITGLHRDIGDAIQVDGESTSLVYNQDENTYEMHYGITLSSGYNAPDAGIETIKILNKDNPDKTATVYLQTGTSNIVPFGDKYLLTGIVSQWKDGTSLITDYSRDTKFSFDIRTEWKLGETISIEITKDPPELTKPNIPLNSENNDVVITRTGSGSPFYTFVDFGTEETVYTNEALVFSIIESEVEEGGNSYKDINNDPLNISLDPDISGTYSLNLSEEDYSPGSIYIIESLLNDNDDSTIDLNSYPLNTGIVFDNILNIGDDFSSIISSNGRNLLGNSNITKDLPDTITINMDSLEDIDFVDESGIDYLSVSIQKEGSSEIGIFELFSESYEFIKSNYSDGIITLDNYSDFLSNYNGVIEDGNYIITLEIGDRAGNTESRTHPFQYDTKFVYIPEGLTDFVVDSVLTDYDYVPSEQKLLLSIDKSEALWDENIDECELSLVISDEMEALGFSFGPKTSLGNYDTFPLQLPEGFTSNSLQSVQFSITDAGGNPNTKTLSFYLPVVLGEDVINHLAEIDEEYIESGVYQLAWNKTSIETLKLYRLGENDESVEIIMLNDPDRFIDSERSVHGEYSYSLHGINGSGYESSDEESLDFLREVKNISPEITQDQITYQNRYSAGGLYYLGPLSSLAVTGTDTDGDQLEGRVILKDDFLSVVTDYMTIDEIGLYLDFSAVMEEVKNNYGYTEGSELGLVFEYRDVWTREDQVYYGEEQRYSLEYFIYDEAGPDITFTPDLATGYSISHDGFGTFLEDSLSGLASAALLVYFRDDLGEETLYLEESLQDSNHFSLPESDGYRIVITAEDNLGNKQEFTELDFVVDSTAPAISEGLITDFSDTTYHTASPQIPVTFNWTDGVTGIIEAFVEIQMDGEKIAERKFSFESNGGFLENSGIVSEYAALDLSAIDSESELSLSLKVIDYAGNVSVWYDIPASIILDMLPPEVSVSGGSVFNEYNGIKYLSTSSKLSSLDVQVIETNPGDYDEWILVFDDLEYRSTLEEVIESVQMDGLYSLKLKSIDKAGNIGTSDEIKFILDTLSPEFNGQAPVSIDNLYPGQKISLGLSAEDLNPVTGYELWAGLIGDQEPSLSDLLEGSVDGELEVSGAMGEYILSIPEIDPGRYVVKLRAIDICGNISEYSVQYELNIITDENYLTVTDSALYSNNNSRLSAKVSYFGNKEVSLYRYRAVEFVEGLTSAVSDWQEGTDSLLTIEFTEALTEGHRYGFEVEAQCKDGYWVESASSLGTIIDTGSPVISVFNAEPFCTDLFANLDWNVDDNHGLSNLEVKFERYQRDSQGDFITENYDGIEYFLKDNLGTVLMENEQIGSGRKINFPDGVSLETGDRIAISLVVQDYAGNISEASGGVVIFDNTPPSSVGIIDSGDYINPQYDALAFTLDSSVSDLESGIDNVMYQVLKGNDSLAEDRWILFENYLNINPKIEISVQDVPEEGQTAILAVKVINKAGIQSTVYSNGIIIDSTKPYIARIDVNDGRSYSDSLDLSVEIQSFDQTSIVSEVWYRRGEFTGGEWNSSKELSINNNELDEFVISMETGTVIANEKIWYEFFVIDSAGNSSLPFYSQGILYKPEQSGITDLTGEYRDGKIYFSWSSSASELSNVSYDVYLVKEGTVLAEEDMDGSIQAWDTEAVDEGVYQFSITGTNVIDMTTTAALTVIVDTSSPVISDITVTPFVSDSIGFDFNASDSISYVNEWQYRIGLSGSPGSVTDGWITNNEVISIIEETHMFIDLPGGENVNDKDHLIVEAAARDRFGNWSSIVASDWSLVDRTAPGEIVVDIPQNTLVFDGEEFVFETRYLIRATAIDGVEINAQDGESGILGYRWFIGEIPDGSDPQIPGQLPFKALDTATTILRETGLTFKGTVFEDGKRYKVFISLRNRAGVDSDWFSTSEIVADFSAPEAVVSIMEPGQVGTDLLLSRPVINGPVELEINTTDSLSEAVIIEVKVYNPDSNLIVTEKKLLNGASGIVYIPFSPEEENRGIYLVEVNVEDIVGNENTEAVQQFIRYNAPPQISLPKNMVVNPGRPFTLSAFDWNLTDQDGINFIRYTFSRDGYENIILPVIPEEIVEITLFHSDSRLAVTEYTLECFVEDNLGQSKAYVTTVEVNNTQEGPLYVDEVWSGIHYITGPVIVPSGITLAISPDTEIVCKGGVSGTDSEPAELIIENGAFLVHEGNAGYELFEGSSVSWNGILLKGTGNFEGVEIAGARRGLTVTSSAVLDEIASCLFIDNITGLHLLKSGISVIDSGFSGNKYYGIKEDNNASPTMLNSVFGSNGIDYYDSELTVIDMDTLNGLGGNSGNIEKSNLK